MIHCDILYYHFSHHIMLIVFCSVSPLLISRFKEREENVKSDIFSVYVSLLRQTKPMAAALPADTELGSDHPVRLLRAQIPAIVKSVTRQLREKGFKTRQVNKTSNLRWEHWSEI